MRSNKVEKCLRYEFSQSEILELGKTLAEANSKLARIEQDKKRVTADFGSQISNQQSLIQTVSQNISSGYEMRQIICHVVYNHPAQGRKTIVRTDTEEIVEIVEMTDDELQEQLPL